MVSENLTVQTLLNTITIDLLFGSILVAAYSWLRTFPSLQWCYAARTALDAEDIDDFGRTRPDPPPKSFGGLIKYLWQFDPVENLHVIGPDALVLLRFLRMLWMFFAISSLFGIFVLLPFHANGKNLVSPFADLTIAHIATGSRVFWIHVISVYFNCILLLTLLWRESALYLKLKKKVSFVLNGAQPPVLLISDIPKEFQDEQRLVDYLNEVLPDQILS